MYFGEVLLLSRYGCQEGINLLVQHTVSSQGHSSSHTDTQRALTSCLNHIHISKGMPVTPMANEAWVLSSTPAIKHAWGNYKRGVWGKNLCSLSIINVAARCFFKRLIPSYCSHAELGQYWSKEESWSYGQWAESWLDREGEIFNERFDGISRRWDHKSAPFSGYIIFANTIFIIYLLIHYFFNNLQNSSKIHI